MNRAGTSRRGSVGKKREFRACRKRNDSFGGEKLYEPDFYDLHGAGAGEILAERTFCHAESGVDRGGAADFDSRNRLGGCLMFRLITGLYGVQYLLIPAVISAMPIGMNIVIFRGEEGAESAQACFNSFR